MPLAYYDDGGGVDPMGGMNPSVQTMNPVAQNEMQRYQAMTPEQLQELAIRLGPTKQGQMVQQILQQKRLRPQAQQLPQQPAQSQPQMAGGGMIPRRADGGPGLSASEASPWWTRAEARTGEQDSGFLHGTSSGRADALTTTAPSGAYIIPADVVAGIGEGNSLAGAALLDESMNSMPWGIKTKPNARGTHGMPDAPPPYKDKDPGPTAEEIAKAIGKQTPVAEAGGGHVKDSPAKRIPVMLSHGEYQISPAQVRSLGNGNLKHGHEVLDALVLSLRKKHIEKLKKLPPPAK